MFSLMVEGPSQMWPVWHVFVTRDGEIAETLPIAFSKTRASAFINQLLRGGAINLDEALALTLLIDHSSLPVEINGFDELGAVVRTCARQQIDEERTNNPFSSRGNVSWPTPGSKAN